MTSYKTLVFGTIAFVCAASPAFADSGSAVPGPSRHDSGSAVPAPMRPLDSGSAVPRRKDSGSAVPAPMRPLDSGSAVPRRKYVVISGVAGLPVMAVDVSWLMSLIDH